MAVSRLLCVPIPIAKRTVITKGRSPPVSQGVLWAQPPGWQPAGGSGAQPRGIAGGARGAAPWYCNRFAGRSLPELQVSGERSLPVWQGVWGRSSQQSRGEVGGLQAAHLLIHFT